MTIAFWCVLIAGVMPYVAVGLAKSDRSYLRHNDSPRDWEANLQGRSRRAHAAHLNSFEAFPLFAAGVIIAYLVKAPQNIVDIVAVVFIAARLAYLWAYLNDRATLRSTIWAVGFAATVTLFAVAGASR